MTQYDKQIVLQFISNSQADSAKNKIVTDAGDALHNKFITSKADSSWKIVRKVGTTGIELELDDVFPWAQFGNVVSDDWKWRLFVVGHGTPTSDSVAGLSVDKMVQFIKRQIYEKIKPLIDCTSDGFMIQRVSLVSCIGGSTMSVYKSGSSTFLIGKPPLDTLKQKSFGSELHKELKGICSEVSARTSLMSVTSDGKKWVADVFTSLGSGDKKHHGKNSKILYEWSGNTQTARYETYD